MDEKEPVDDSEFVYRRIHPSFCNPNLALAIQRDAFRPTEDDTTGLSVLRALFARPVDTLTNLDHARAKVYYVVRLAVRDLRNRGLTVVPEPDPSGPPGHAVIPELSWPAYQARKQHWKPILVELAKLASAAIVHRPDVSGGAEP
jgi:hypothetical protein